MKRFTSQLKKQAESIRLSATERRDLRDRLEAYLEYHPLPQQLTQQKAERYITAEPFRTLSLPKLYLKAFGGVFALFILVGIPLIAERTLPGDALYPIKVQFNEELRSTLALSPYEKIEWEAERLSRRVAEARLLASEGKLTEQFESDVADAVRAHSHAAQQEIANLREDDAEEAAIAEIVFASALDVQSAVLKAEKEKASTTDSGEGAIAVAIEEQRREANLNQSQSEDVPSAARLHARIEIETTRAHELFKSVAAYATPQEITDIERRLQDIDRKLVSVFDTEDLDDEKARALLREALQGVKKLIAFMTDIDVRESVVIEELIPVELMPEEYVAQTTTKLLYVQTVIDKAEGGVASTTNESVIAKVEASLVELERLSEVASTSIASSSYKTALAAALSAEELANEVANLLGISMTPDEGTFSEDQEKPATTTDEVLPETPAATTTDENVAEPSADGDTSTTTATSTTDTPIGTSSATNTNVISL